MTKTKQYSKKQRQKLTDKIYATLDECIERNAMLKAATQHIYNTYCIGNAALSKVLSCIAESYIETIAQTENPDFIKSMDETKPYKDQFSKILKENGDIDNIEDTEEREKALNELYNKNPAAKQLSDRLDKMIESELECISKKFNLLIDETLENPKNFINYMSPAIILYSEQLNTEKAEQLIQQYTEEINKNIETTKKYNPIGLLNEKDIKKYYSDLGINTETFTTKLKIQSISPALITQFSEHIAAFLIEYLSGIEIAFYSLYTNTKVKKQQHKLQQVNAILSDHSNPCNIIFGTYGKPLPLDNKQYDIATDKEYYITAINGKKTKHPLATVVKGEILDNTLTAIGLNAFDKFVYKLIDSTYYAGNRFTTTKELWGIVKDSDSCKGTVADRLVKSIEKQSAIRLTIETKDRNGNPVSIHQNLLYTKGETRIADNKKKVTGYALLAAPALHELTTINNQYYKLPPALYDYGKSGRQDRALLIADTLISRIELQKHTLEEQLKTAEYAARAKAKSDTKSKANAEGKKPDYKHLATEQYYTKPSERFYKAIINFDEFCKTVECVDDIAEISKDIKAAIKKEIEKCLNYYIDLQYIQGFTLPAANHNKTADIIIELNKDINKPLILPDSRAEKKRKTKEEKACK